MKRKIILPASLTAALLLLVTLNGTSQVYDDIYYNPGQTGNSGTTTETYTTPTTTSSYPAEDEEYRVYSDDFSTEKYYDEEGNSYVVNNYYYEEDDMDDYSYSMYLNRFYYPYYGFSYYSPCYDPWFWNPGFGIGWNSWTGWNVGWGYSWGWNAGWGWGYGNPYYNPYYNPWYSPYAYYGWGYSPWYNPYAYNPWGNPFYNGYNNGYWNGYANGYYDGYYDGYGEGYYYGPRNATSSNTGEREYTAGVMGTDKGYGGGIGSDLFDRNDDRIEKTGTSTGNYQVAEDKIVNTPGKTVGQESPFTVADREPGTVKVVKHYSADEQKDAIDRGSSNTRPATQDKYKPAQQQTAPKGYEKPKTDGRPDYQWNDNSQDRQEYQKRDQPTYTRPEYNQEKNNNNYQSQPKVNTDRSKTYESQPKYDSNRSSNNSYNRSSSPSNNSGSYRSSGSTSGSSRSSSGSSNTYKRDR